MKAPIIEPEDKEPDEQITIRLRPDLARDLRAYGRYMNGSSVSHVIGSLLKWVFDKDAAFKAYKQEHPEAGDFTPLSRRKQRTVSNGAA